MVSSLGRYDVAIVGGGPGGSTLGALLALRGRRVCIIERDVFPRFRIGESLLPFSMPTFERSGVLRKIHDAGCMVKPGARFVVDETGEQECFDFANVLDDAYPYAFQVKRAPFDKLLLDHARELGATVFQPAVAREFRAEPERAVVTTNKGDVEAQVVCDASGRWTFMSGRQKQRRIHPSHRKVAVYGHFKDVVRCEKEPGNIIIVGYDLARKGWFWVIPFSDGTNSVGVVADSAYYHDLGLDPEAFFHKCVRESRTIAPRMADAKPVGEIRSEADFSYTSDTLVGDRLLKIGDAGAFIDPVFSSGVLLSTQSADAAADALEAAFESGDFSGRAFEAYERRVRHGTRVFWAFIDAFYNRGFLKQMVASRRRPLLQKSITSLLAGDVYNPDNQLIAYLTGEGGAYDDPELKRLLG